MNVLLEKINRRVERIDFRISGIYIGYFKIIPKRIGAAENNIGSVSR